MSVNTSVIEVAKGGMRLTPTLHWGLDLRGTKKMMEVRAYQSNRGARNGVGWDGMAQVCCSEPRVSLTKRKVNPELMANPRLWSNPLPPLATH